MAIKKPQYTCFYSYKGGVGRSTALTNLACYQALIEHKKVLIIDLDFEAPGQHKSGLFKDKAIQESHMCGGFIDLCYEYQTHQQSLSNNKQTVFNWDINNYMLRSIRETLENISGEVHLMPATKLLDDRYTNKLNKIDWTLFFGKYKGYQLLHALILYCELEKFDSVLIDSRTGLSDPYYIATSWLSDTTICFTLPNKQSVEGCKYAMDKLFNKYFQQKYGKKLILPVLSMMPSSGGSDESVKREQEIKEKEWHNITEFVTKIEYDSTMILQEKILALDKLFKDTDYGKSIMTINDALTQQDSSYYLLPDDINIRHKDIMPTNPFINLSIQYCKPEVIVSQYTSLYPSIEEELIAFQPSIVYGARGTGKTMIARYLSYEIQLLKHTQESNITPMPNHFKYIGLWISLDSDFLAAFNAIDEDRKLIYTNLFGLFFDMLVLRKALKAMQTIGGLVAWIDLPQILFELLYREMGIECQDKKNINIKDFNIQLEERLQEIRAYINNPHRIEQPYRFQGNTLMKLLNEQLKDSIEPYFIVFVDEFENYAKHQQKKLNTRVKHVKRSDNITYKLLMKNTALKTSETDASGQELELTHDYRAHYLDESMTNAQFKSRVEEAISKYLKNSLYFKEYSNPNKLFYGMSQEEEAKQICNKSNKKILEYIEKHHNISRQHPLFDWLRIEPNLLKQALLVVIINRGQEVDYVLANIKNNTQKAKDWYVNYARGTIFWLCTIHRKSKTYSGFNEISALSGNNIRFVIDFCYAICESWIVEYKNNDTFSLPINYALQNKSIHQQSYTYFRILDKYKFTDKVFNRFVERLGNLFAAIHKSPRQSEPEINHFSPNGDMNQKTLDYLEGCRKEDLVRQLPSNKQKSSSDYLPYAYQIHPKFMPHFGISWRRKKKLSLSVQQIETLCFDDDITWKKQHNLIKKQYHSGKMAKAT